MPNKSSFSYGAGFRSLTREIADPVALPVKGKLPSWLNGTLLRTGPSKFEVEPEPIITGLMGWRCCTASPSGWRRYLSRPFPQEQEPSAPRTRLGTFSFGEFATDPSPYPLRARRRDFQSQADRQLLRRCFSAYARAAVAFTDSFITGRFRRTRSRHLACSTTSSRSKVRSRPLTRTTMRSGRVITTTYCPFRT